MLFDASKDESMLKDRARSHESSDTGRSGVGGRWRRKRKRGGWCSIPALLCYAFLLLCAIGLTVILVHFSGPGCTDREIFVDGKCQPCPLFQRAQLGGTECDADECLDRTREIVIRDGTCKACLSYSYPGKDGQSCT